MLYGIRPLEQQRLAESGETMRVYLPYGSEWYGYLMRRLAERPAEPVILPEVADLQEVAGRQTMSGPTCARPPSSAPG